MSITKSHMLKLCTLVETRLAEKSLPSEIKKLSASDLQNNIDRMRKLRNKQRDLYRRQTLKTRQLSKTFFGVKVEGLNARTKEKVVFFEKVLDAFEARLLFLQQKIKPSEQKTAIRKKKSKPLAQGRVAAKTANKKPTVAKEKKTLETKPASKSTPRATKKNAPPKGVGARAYVSAGAKAAAQRSHMQQSRSKPIQGHIMSAGKRTQAKRDSR